MKKKLIEMAMPIEIIDKYAAEEKMTRLTHPSTLHLWWARRPSAAARAVIFGALVDDPSSKPEEFPTEKAIIAERKRLFKLMSDYVDWRSAINRELQLKIQKEIEKCLDGNSPELVDPFAGGGAIPMEAQRMGLKVTAGDLNPVAVMINKASVEFPSKFSGRLPVNPEFGKKPAFFPFLDLSGDKKLTDNGVLGLGEDTRYYATALLNIAMEKVGSLYPTVKIKSDDGAEKEFSALAWIWTRTVKCPNPACGVMAPLAHSFVLSKKINRNIYAEPSLKNGQIAWAIKNGEPKVDGTVKRDGAHCVVCQSPISFSHIREEGQNKKMGVSLMAIVTRGEFGRVYCPPNPEHEKAASLEKIALETDCEIPDMARSFGTRKYGLTNYSDLFTARQLKFLDCLTESLPDLATSIEKDAVLAGLDSNAPGLEEGGDGAKAYAEAIRSYLALLIDKMADYHSSCCSWNRGNESIRNVFSRQAIPMIWDYAEANPFAMGPGCFDNISKSIAWAIAYMPMAGQAKAYVLDAKTDPLPENAFIVTDPPYYDFISYSNLSDFFYIWLRRSLKSVFKSVFKTIRTPKNDELIVEPERFGGDKNKAREFYEKGLAEAFDNIYKSARVDLPTVVFCPFKIGALSDDDKIVDIDGPGWEQIAIILIESGFLVTKLWSLATDSARWSEDSLEGRSLVIVCRKSPKIEGSCERRDFNEILKKELAPALDPRREPSKLQRYLNGLSVGLGIISRYQRILDANGSILTLRRALAQVKIELKRQLG